MAALAGCRVQLQLDGPAELFVVAAQDLLTRAHDEPPDLGVRGAGRREDDNDDGERESRAPRRPEGHRGA